jgi:glyoxylase-like metal-dependent hydrolase (beta-lactamase superfamily II)
MKSNERHFGVMRIRTLAAFASFLLAACVSGPGTQLQAPERVDEGIYTLRLPVRVHEGTTFEPARVTFISGPRGVVVIDSGLSARDGESILAAVEHAAHAPVRLLVLTHPSQEAIFGASAFARRGVSVAMSMPAAELVAARCGGCLERLRGTLGDAAMAGTGVVRPTRMLGDGEIIDDIGRPLRVLTSRHSSAPGALALLDQSTGTVVAGSVALVRAVPDIRDGDLAGWRAALSRIEATRCRRLIPAYGPIGSCADVPAFRGYLDGLEAHVSGLRARGVELGGLDPSAALPRYAPWDRYLALHSANASRMYLRLEQDDLAKP